MFKLIITLIFAYFILGMLFGCTTYTMTERQSCDSYSGYIYEGQCWREADENARP